MPLSSSKPERANLQNCEDEPIRIPGAIQPHGALLCLRSESLEISHVSANVEDLFGIPPEILVGKKLSSLVGYGLFDRSLIEKINSASDSVSVSSLDSAGLKTTDGSECFIRVLPQEGRILVELLPEKTTLDQPLDFGLLHSAVMVLRGIDSLSDFSQAAAMGFRRISGYDRVMVYQFSPDGSGEVIAEARREDLPTYMGMRYPATDIPKQARELYLENHVRIIPDIAYAPIDLLHAENDKEPVDLSHAQLRSVSPLHVEYLMNMGVGATLTISIVVKGELRGLIACHHYSTKHLHHRMLILCEYFAQAFSLQFGNRLEAEKIRRTEEINTVRSDLANRMHTLGPVEILRQESVALMGMLEADGVSFFNEGRVHLAGKTPGYRWVERVRAWLQSRIPNRVNWSSNALAEDLPPELKEGLGDLAGALGVAMGENWESCWFWFRKEVEQTVVWAGKPDKLDLEGEAQKRLTPRKSFDLWRERIRGKSLEWDSLHVAAAINFVRYDTALTMEVNEKNRANALLEDMTAELQRSNGDLSSFAYAASHDLQEPLRAVAGCLQILEKRVGERFTDDEKKVLGMAVDGARRMQRLVGDLLSYSRLNTDNSTERPVDSSKELKEALMRLDDAIKREKAVVNADCELPTVLFSKSQLATVFQNLIGNALKFRSDRSPRVSVSARRDEDDPDFWVFRVADNGIGIGNEYLEDIFTIFARLHTQDQYEGSGIGLSICRKIVERHGGEIWVESKEGQGSCFCFSIKGAVESPQS